MMKIKDIFPSKSEVEAKGTDLTSKSLVELLEIQERQVKLLKNNQFTSKLPDKGAKIQAFYEKIVNELKAKREEQQTCQLLDKLNLNAQTVQSVEWEGKLKKNNAYLDSDDDSEPEDVMHILSQSTSQEKILKVLQPDKPLVTPEDLVSIGDSPHVKYLVEKTETQTKGKTTEKFKPFKTTKSDVHNPDKEILRKKHKHWEVTAATPPPSIHGPAKVLSLNESLKLQKDYNVHIKEVEAQHAAAKLLARSGIKMPELPKDTSEFGKYRDADSDDSNRSDDEGSDKEVHDEEPERGGVIFTVMK